MRRMIYFPNDEAFFGVFSLMQSPKVLFRFSLPLFGWLVMMKTENSYFAEKASI